MGCIKLKVLLVTGCVAGAMCFVAGCAGRRDRQAEVSFESCLSDLTNVAAMAETPLGTPGMISTYDRTGGNNDFADWSRVDHNVIEIAKLDGPGCVKRIWATGGPKRQWLFFVDGEKEPRIRVTKDELFGGKSPFLKPLCGDVSGGRYCYVPIPYRKSLRIAADIGDARKAGVYYQINYESYPKHVSVTSFPQTLSSDQEVCVKSTARAWQEREKIMRAASARCGDVRSFTLRPGQKNVWLNADDAGVLRTFRVRLTGLDALSPLQKTRVLRELVLRFYWDGGAQPSVEAPLGDFFCNGLNTRPFSSLVVANLDGMFVSRFPMPFVRGIRSELRNDGPHAIGVEVAYDVGPLPEGSEPNRFHARFNSAVSSGRPYNLLRLSGAGHYVGCYLTGICMDGSWFMIEGDDMIRLNGETTPSLHGCGMEDYFNGGWYYVGIFDLPIHGLVEKAPVRLGQYRFLLPDPVSFKSGIQVDWEFGHANQSRGYMSSVAYWYQPEAGPAGSVIPSMARRFPPPDPMEPYAIMAQLFELERLGLYRQARDRCLIYNERFPRSQMADLLALRADAYAEVVDGFDAVRAQYAKMAQTHKGSRAGHQAQALLWFNDNASHALLGAHIKADYRMYIDGVEVGHGNGKGDLAVYPLKIEPGEHTLSVEATPKERGGYVSLYLRTHGGDISFGHDWRATQTAPPGWPTPNSMDGDGWFDASTRGYLDMFPNLGDWRFMPNAFVNMQSGRQPVVLWYFWSPKPKYKKVYMVRRFVVSAPKDEAPTHGSVTL